MELSPPQFPHTPIERIEHVLQGAIGLCKNQKIAIAADIHRIRESLERVLSLTPLLSAASEGKTAPIEMFEDSLTVALREIEEEEGKEQEKDRKGFAVRLQVVQDYVSDLQVSLNSNGNVSETELKRLYDSFEIAPPCHGEVPRRGLESIKAGLPSASLEHSALPSSQDR